MEGVGSRLGRASSRYGPPAAAAVFSGPVRKWKKKWVHVSSNHHHHHHNNNNSHFQSNGHSNNNSSRLLLRRWTPLAATAADVSSEEPPKRRFRYAPIAVVEEQRKAAEKLEQEANTSEANQFNAWNELNAGKDLKKEAQESTRTHLDLGLYLEGGNGDQDSDSQSKDAQMKKVNSGDFWTG